MAQFQSLEIASAFAGTPVGGQSFTVTSAAITNVLFLFTRSTLPFPITTPYPRLALFTADYQLISSTTYSPGATGWDQESAPAGRIGFVVSGLSSAFNPFVGNNYTFIWQFIGTFGGSAEICLATGTFLFTRVSPPPNPANQDTNWLARTDLVVQLVDGPTITTDVSTGDIFAVTLGGNRTLGAPINPTSGQRIMWRFRQDSTGSRTLAFDAIFRFSSDIPSPTLSAGPHAVDYMGCIYNRDDNRWDVLAIAQGY